MNIHAFAPSPFRQTSGCPWLAGLLYAAIACLPLAAGLHAAAPAGTSASSSSVDRLISKLPDPAQFTKSPLESAVQDQAETTPEYRRIVSDMRSHNFPAALTEVRALAGRYPDSHPKVHLLHGLLAMFSKQFGEADEAFHLLVTLTPTRGTGWLMLANVQAAQKHAKEALAYARKSVEVEPSLLVGWLSVANCEYMLRHFPESTAAARRGTQLNPRSAIAWYALGRCEIIQHKFAEAGGDFRRAAGFAPDALPIQGALALCLIETGRTADAIAPLERVVSKAPNDVLAATKLAYCYMATGKASQGVDVCRRAVRVQPKYAAAWDMLGLCYRKAGKNREALDAFQHAVNLAPGDLNVRTHLDEAGQATTSPTHA